VATVFYISIAHIISGVALTNVQCEYAVN